MTRPGDLLEFPSAEGLTLLDHTYSIEQVIDLCELWLSHITDAPDFERDRLAAKCPVPFELQPENFACGGTTSIGEDLGRQ